MWSSGYQETEVKKVKPGLVSNPVIKKPTLTYKVSPSCMPLLYSL